MEQLQLPPGKPRAEELTALAERCKQAYDRMKSAESEVRLPLFFEFSGSPKSGKTSIIGIVAHFFKRLGIDVAQPAEGASLRTPTGLRDDWFPFNAWSGCYALQEILVECSQHPPRDVVLLDRALFDVMGWVEFLCSSLQRITEDDRDRISAFFALDFWGRRQNGVFLFTADHKTSLERENHDKLTARPGSVMNRETLEQLQQAYHDVALREVEQFNRLYHLDTSHTRGSVSFQRIAYVVAEKIIDVMEELTTHMLLVTEPVSFQGFTDNRDIVRATVEKIINKNQPQFLERWEAEKTLQVQQVVPYAILQNQQGKYFWAQRRAKLRRKELQKKYTILVGGHAEKRDWDKRAPEELFARCLRRELEEELVGLRILNIEPLGFVNDPRNNMGAHHLAFVHRIRVGGKTGIRRQAIDQEFGRESVGWKTADEIRAAVSELDPWSQIVAHALFGGLLPDQDLFTNLQG